MIRVATFLLPLLLAASPALAQISVTPLPGPPSCYAGTSGPDHTMFLRAKSSQADCDVIGGGSPCLARREFPGDGPNGRPISLLAAIVVRPSVTGAGEFVAFSEFGFNVCLMATASEDTEGCVGRDLLTIDPYSIWFSPAGDQVAVTRLDPDTGFQPTNDIFVGDPNTFGPLEQYEVVTADVGGTLLQIETVQFTVDGDFLIVDGFNPFSGWGIYAVSRSTGVTSTVIAPVAGLAIRNPSLAQTSDDFMVFDAQNTTTLASTVYAANLLTGALRQVATSGILSYPSYTGDDGAVVFSEADGSVQSMASLDMQPLGPDRMTPEGTRTRWLTDGGAAAIYRRGAWNGTLLDPTFCVPPNRLRLEVGYNQFSVARSVPAAAQSCFELLAFLGGPGAVERVSRINAVTQTVEECRYEEGSPTGDDFAVETGGGYFVRMLMPTSVDVAGALSCPDVSLAGGVNLIGVPGPADGLGCFGLLDAIGAGSVATIERLNPVTLRFEPCAFNEASEPKGVDFPVEPGAAYLIHMQEAVGPINLNDTADSSKCGT